MEVIYVQLPLTWWQHYVSRGMPEDIAVVHWNDRRYYIECSRSRAETLLEDARLYSDPTTCSPRDYYLYRSARSAVRRLEKAMA